MCEEDPTSLNAVLERLREQRDAQVTFIDELLSRVDADGRDLVDAETSNLNAARERIAELDAQIAPLDEFEALRGTHRESQRQPDAAPRPTDPLAGRPRAASNTRRQAPSSSTTSPVAA